MNAEMILKACAAALAAALFAGCAMVPKAPVAEADRAKIRRVVIAVADFPPTVVMRIQTDSSGAVGKVQAAVAEEVTRRLKATDLREPLIAALRQELAVGDFEATFLPRSEARTSADSSPAYKAQAKGVDAVLEVSLRTVSMLGAGTSRIMTRGSNELLAGLGAVAQIRLIDAADQRVMGDFRVSNFSGFAPLEDWMTTRGGRFDGALELVNRRLAADIVDLTFREYAPPEPRADGKVPAPAPAGTRDLAALDPLYRIHGLRPVNLLPTRGNPFKIRRPMYDAFTPTEADSTRPTLEWESFPRGYPWAPERADAARISGVTYELRLYNAARLYVYQHADQLIPERVLYERAGLPEPAHRPEAELEPCEVYFWTARARFTLDGRVRVTPWMSTWSRGLFAFVTPAAPGKEGECAYGK